MKVHLVRRGQGDRTIDVYAIELDNGAYPFRDWFTYLGTENPSSRQSLLVRIGYRADNPGYRDTRIISKIETYENVWEVRHGRADRTLFGFFSGLGIAFSYGLDKNEQAESFYKRAESLHAKLAAALRARGAQHGRNQPRRRTGRSRRRNRI